MSWARGNFAGQMGQPGVASAVNGRLLSTSSLTGGRWSNAVQINIYANDLDDIQGAVREGLNEAVGGML